MNVKIRNEIRALIRIKERNNNGGDLREFICAREVEGYGEKTYLIAFDHYSICARYCGEAVFRAITFGNAFNVDLWNTSWTRIHLRVQTRKPVKCGSVSGAITG
ncbi:Mu prophage protein [Escherichia coli]|nr:Mu prophage protein [Escherichia coli]